MGRWFWSLFFLCVPVGAVALYALCGRVSPLQTATLPANYTATGETIDHLYWLIHYLSAAILLGTGCLLAWSIWRFGGSRPQRARHVHGNLALEIVWTLIPAGILVWLAFYQMEAWAENKILRPQIEVDGVLVDQPPLARITAKQFGWEVLYAGPDGKLDSRDDLFVENELYLPVGENVVLELRSRDVIHSFFVPELRVKQDVVPGLTQACWFRIESAAQGKRLDIVCAELCGWGHYKMNALLYPVSRGQFEAKLADDAAARLRVAADPTE